MAGDSSYTPLYSGQSHAIFSMGQQDLFERKAFLHDLSVVLQSYGFPNGASDIDTTGKVWTFYEDVVSKSRAVFTLTLEDAGQFLYWYKIGKVENTGRVGALVKLFGLLPNKGV